MHLTLLPDSFAVCRLVPSQEVPAWVWKQRAFVSITFTTEELSIVCCSSDVPSGVQCEKDWSVLKVEGPLDFSLTGILAQLINPLAQHHISIFALSTYDTDYLLVKTDILPYAREVLEAAGTR